jgi:hypothetical protein
VCELRQLAAQGERAVKQLRTTRTARTAAAKGYTRERLRTTPIGIGLASVEELRTELDGYIDVLLGRVMPPVVGDHALQEVADAYYARSSEMTMLIQRGEADGLVKKGSEYYVFRNGELRTFRELAEKSASLGSRRLTARSVESERARLGRDSAR